ncbi:hypothetical protein, partial [Pseudomonas juntendi]|uniref:hypothetical protein n=1 Tax=Pseudomonas juntendi TaxID=2666183 RepID=UPI001C70F933
EQTGLAAGFSLDVGHNEKCSVSFDTEHSLKGPGRLLGFHTICAGPFFVPAKTADKKKGRFDPPTFFSVVPACPKHHPDEIASCDVLGLHPESLCMSLCTVRILAGSAARASAGVCRILPGKHLLT